jgi:hypothetical protein
MESLSANEVPGPYENWQDDLPNTRFETAKESSDNYWAGRALGHALRATLGDAPDAIVEDVRRRLSQVEANAINPRNMGAQLCVPDLALLPPSIARGITHGFTDPRPERPVTEIAYKAPRHQK